MTKKSVQPQDKYVLRMPDGLRDLLKAIAAANGRSLNAEMIRRLENSFDAVALSIPEAMRANLEACARVNGRSLEDEILYRLEKSNGPKMKFIGSAYVDEEGDYYLRTDPTLAPINIENAVRDIQHALDGLVELVRLAKEGEELAERDDAR